MIPKGLFLHILFVWAYWQYPEVAMEFLQKVRERGHELSVLVGKKGENIDVSPPVDGIDIHFAASVDIGSRIASTPYPILRNVSPYVKMVNPDVVHVNSHLFLSSYQAIEAAVSQGIPSVVTVHGFSVRRGLATNTLQAVYLRTVGRSLFEKVSAVICLTESDANRVTSIVGNKNKVYVIPNAVNTGLFRPDSVKDPNLVAWVGRLVPEKGLVYLLKAMQKIVKEHDETKLVLVGAGPMKTELYELVKRLDLEGSIAFVGSVNRVEVAKILARSSIFAFPSLKEGLPISVLEAMACGTPIVGSAIPGIRDVITDGQDGILVPPESQEQLANAILTLLNDSKLRKRIGQKARQTVTEKYNWDIVLGKIEKLYYEVVRETN
jgi:glycosyltransferase involved in cell wall biosynthesis